MVLTKLLVEENQITLDEHGFLTDISQWSPAVATEIAKQHSIDLDEAHWEIIYLVQEFRKEFQLSPAMRPLVNYVKQKLGPEKGNSMYLLKLFPGSPAKLSSQIAGIPKPDNCL